MGTYRKRFLEEEQPLKTIVITLGRFNPPTIGHSLVFKTLTKLKDYYKADQALVYATHSHDSRKNPLPYDIKISFLERLLAEKHPEVEVANSNATTIIHVLKELEDKAERVIVVVGGDRIVEFETLLNKYNGKEYEFEDIKVVSAGDRDPDSDSVSGMSASKVREAVLKGDKDSFRKGIDSFDEVLIEDLWLALRRGLNAPMSEAFRCREAVSYIEHIRFIEASMSDEQLKSFYMKRFDALYAKAGVPGLQGGETQEEGPAPITETEEGKALNEKYPEVKASSYSGVVGVLLIENILGTKFTTQYIGKFYEILNEVTEGKLSRLRVVIRQLRTMDTNDKKEELLNLKIAWDSKVGNPSYLAKSTGMKIDFATQTTEDLLNEINGDVIMMHSIGALTTPMLENYIKKFNEKYKDQEKNFDIKTLGPFLRRYKMTGMGNNAMTIEKDARAQLDALITQALDKNAAGAGAGFGDEAFKAKIEKFSTDYGVDSKIIGNFLIIRQAKSKDPKKDSKRKGDIEQTFEELGDALGITGLLILADNAVEKYKKSQTDSGNKVVQATGKARAQANQ